MKLLLVGLLFLGIVFESAAETIPNIPKLQIRLIRATNDSPESSDPKVLSLKAQLKADFGFSNYQQICFLETPFIRDQPVVFQMPDDFGITLTYHGQKHGKREFFVETEYRGKKFVGFYATFPKAAKPVLIRGPGTRDGRYIITLSPG
jgi:hypothetical protein